MKTQANHTVSKVAEIAEIIKEMKAASSTLTDKDIFDMVSIYNQAIKNNELAKYARKVNNIYK